MTIRLILLIVGVLTISACNTDPTATENTFVYESFVGEGRPEYVTMVDQIEIRDTPNSSEIIAHEVSVSKGQSLTFNNAVTRTLRKGQVEVQSDVSIQVREFGEIDSLTADRYYDATITSVRRKVTANDKPELLMWMSEGNCLLSIQRTVIESSDCPTESDNQWRLVTQPIVESWIEMNIKDSKGWIKVDGQQITEKSRSF